MAYPTGTTFPPRFQPQAPQFNPYGAPAFSAPPALGGPAFSPIGGGFAPQAGAFGLPQAGFNQPAPSLGQPQDAFAQAGASAPAATEGFGDKNVTLSSGGGLYSGKGIAIATAGAVGALYLARGIFAHNWGLNFNWNASAEAGKKALSDLTTDLKKEITEAKDKVSNEFENTLNSFNNKPTQELVDKAKETVKPHTESINKLNAYELNTEEAEAKDNFLKAINDPIEAAETASKATDEAKKSLPEDFVTQATEKLKSAKKTFENKFDGHLKTDEAVENIAETVTPTAEQAAAAEVIDKTPTPPTPPVVQPDTIAAARLKAKREKAKNPVHLPPTKDTRYFGHPDGHFVKSGSSGKLAPLTAEETAKLDSKPPVATTLPDEQPAPAKKRGWFRGWFN